MACDEVVRFYFPKIGKLYATSVETKFASGMKPASRRRRDEVRNRTWDAL